MVDPHGSATALTLAEYLKDKGMRKAHASSMAFAVGSHHGRWVGYEQAGELDENWQRAEHALLDMLWDVLGITEMPQLVQPSLISGWVAGMVSMVDWIGSQDKYFPYCPSVEDYHQYFATQCEVAAQVLGILGFYSLDTSARMRKFHEIFGFAPNDMQQAIADAAVNIGDLDTIIIEAPTGDGKTEAALYLAHQLLTQANLAGMYIAMPTRATSNQLFQRTGDFLSAGFPNRTLNYHLIHSQAEDHELYRQLAVKAAAGNEDSVVAAEWFQPRKRSLLAQFAVGTVDQAMLAVLTVKHFFVRIFALSHKVVILDEVHAYDTYMSTIQERLLGWLRALQSPIILLSATLPSVTRQRLLGEAVDDSVPYPRATLRYRSGEVRTIPLSTQRQRTLNLGWIPAETEALLNILGEQLAEGGCAAVICNTVSEAQAVYEAARAHAAFAPDEVLLFHARFPAPWRDNIEKRVVTEFGKAGPRPHRRLLVATQIIEQSLDLDFDIMVTSVAPIDMLIQRFGRLHRHTRLRPAHLQMPTALLREPLLEAETIDFGRDEFVYHRYILLQTYAWLRPLQALAVPADIEPLIERVYAAEPVLDEAWPEWFQQQTLAAYKDLRRLRDKEQFIARTNVIPAPTDSQLSITVFTDDVTSDEATGSTPSVTTRLIAPGVRIICLHRLGDHTSFDPTELRPCLLDRRPDAALVRDMLRYSVTVQHAGVRRALMQREQHEKLMQIPQLQDARIVVFEQGKARLEGGWNLRLTKELGLVIEGDQE
jgi:CRISPR-associated endonuclease/helicase Cas3